jgi:hypothetical protein
MQCELLTALLDKLQINALPDTPLYRNLSCHFAVHLRRWFKTPTRPTEYTTVIPPGIDRSPRPSVSRHPGPEDLLRLYYVKLADAVSQVPQVASLIPAKATWTCQSQLQVLC